MYGNYRDMYYMREAAIEYNLGDVASDTVPLNRSSEQREWGDRFV